MTRPAALRAGVLFVFLTVIFGGVGLGSHVVAATAMALISGTLFLVMLLFWIAPPHAHSAVPVRIRRPSPYR